MLVAQLVEWFKAAITSEDDRLALVYRVVSIKDVKHLNIITFVESYSIISSPMKLPSENPVDILRQTLLPVASHHFEVGYPTMELSKTGLLVGCSPSIIQRCAFELRVSNLHCGGIVSQVFA